MDPLVNRNRAMAQYTTIRPGYEAIVGSLYDIQAYAAAGQTQLSFFTVPIGQSSKTYSDTNMQLAGQIPANQDFLVQEIEVLFFPTVPAVAAANPSAFGAQAVAAHVNDTYIFRRTGNLLFTVGTKEMLREAPLSTFPAKNNFQVNGAIADVTTAGAALQSRLAAAFVGGRPYTLKIPIMLAANQNFAVTLSWPEGVQAITNPADVGVKLNGILYRKN